MFRKLDDIKPHRTGTLHIEVPVRARVLAAPFRCAQTCPRACDGILAVGATAYRPAGSR